MIHELFKQRYIFLRVFTKCIYSYLIKYFIEMRGPGYVY